MNTQCNALMEWFKKTGRTARTHCVSFFHSREKGGLFGRAGFWLFFLTPLTIGGYLMYLTASAEGMLLRPATFKADAVFYFWDVFKFHITVMGLSIPLAALYASHFRSCQQNQLMLLQGQQNAFNNYYKHKEEFAKHMDDVLSENYLSMLLRCPAHTMAHSEGFYRTKNINRTLISDFHKQIFPHAKTSPPRVNIDFWNNIQPHLKAISLVSKSFNKYEGRPLPQEDVTALYEQFMAMNSFYRVFIKPPENLAGILTGLNFIYTCVLHGYEFEGDQCNFKSSVMLFGSDVMPFFDDRYLKQLAM